MMISIWRSVLCRRLAAFAFAILLILLVVLAISLWVLNVPILKMLKELFKNTQQTTDNLEMPVAEPEDFLRQANGQYLSYHFDDIQDEISDNSNLKQIFQIGSSSNGQRAIIVSLQEDQSNTENSNKNNELQTNALNENKLTESNRQTNSEKDSAKTLFADGKNKKMSKSVNINKIRVLNTPKTTSAESVTSKIDDGFEYSPINDDDEPIYIDADEEGNSGKKTVQSIAATDATKDTGANGIEYFDEIISDHQQQNNHKKYKNIDKSNKYSPESVRNGLSIDSVSVYTKAENSDTEDRAFSGGDSRDIPIIDNTKIFRPLSKNIDVDSDDDDDDYDVNSGSGDFNIADLPTQQRRENKIFRNDKQNYRMETNDKNWYSVSSELISNRKKDSHRTHQQHKNLRKKQLLDQLVEENHSDRQQRKDLRKQHPIAHHFNSYRQSQTTAANKNLKENNSWLETRARRISGNVKKSEERSRQLLFCEDAGSGELCRMLFKEHGTNAVIE